MFALAAYEPAEVFALMDGPRKKRVTLSDGRTFKPNSSRLVLFKDKGTHCVTCGIEGTVFILETQSLDITPHLNLYAVTADGAMILMTKDHIQPKSKGGPNTLENYNPMCAPCNTQKGNTIQD